MFNYLNPNTRYMWFTANLLPFLFNFSQLFSPSSKLKIIEGRIFQTLERDEGEYIIFPRYGHHSSY